jgi:hypothetical protein
VPALSPSGRSSQGRRSAPKPPGVTQRRVIPSNSLVSAFPTSVFPVPGGPDSQSERLAGSGTA